MVNQLRRLDWVLIAGVFIIGIFGLFSLASTNITAFWRQLVWFAIGAAVIIFGSRIDWKWLGAQPWFLYGFYWFSVLLLIVSHLQAGRIRGTKSWIVVGGIQFEPAELAKLALILLLANFFSRRYVTAWYGKNIALSFVYAAIPAVLILAHPDFGSAMVIVAIWVSFLLFGGVHKKRFVVGLVLAMFAVVLMWSYVLKPYQKDRLTSFIFPERDPFGSSYNVIQSKIAIGSAGMFGKGFGLGTQSQLGFLPEAQTDFIFAAFVEEWGLVGGTFLILTFIAVMYRLTLIGLRAEDNYSKFVVLGAITVFLTHFFVNVGSNLGIMPVTGIPFPFFSYGGSYLLTASVLVSIIQRIKFESSI